MGLHLIPDNLKFDFIGVRKISYVLSIIVILIGLTSLIYKGGLKYGIDFAGGATALVKFENSISDEELKKSLEDSGLPGLAIQSYGNDGKSYMLRISTVEENSTGINKALTDTLHANLKGISFEIQRLDMVGPKVGSDLRSKAVEAIYLAILFTAVYISGRFENRWFTAAGMAVALAACVYGLEALGVEKMYIILAAVAVTIFICIKLKLIFALGTIVAILHDILITIGIFSLLDKEFDLTIIAGILTVVGYSLNDTIIVYDRIRENLRTNKAKKPVADVINESINQTMSRTILTSGATLLVVLALLLFGGTMLHDFSLIMFIGVFIGTLSSVFVASPILLIFGDVVVHEEKKDTRPRDADGRIAPQV